MTDLTLIEKWIRMQDAEAFREIALRHAGMVYATCRRILGNPSEAEDAAQECFEVLARTERGPATNLGAWLHRVATNLSLNRIKADNRRRARERQFALERGHTQEIRWDDIYGYVDEAIAGLPEKERTAVVAYFLEGRSQADIALELGVTRQAVQYRVGRGVESIRRALRKKGVPVGTSALAVLLAGNAVEAAPASLTGALGKVALASISGTGSGAVAGTGLVAVGGLTIMAKKTMAAAIVVVAVLAVLWYGLGSSQAPSAPNPATPIAAVVEPPPAPPEMTEAPLAPPVAPAPEDPPAEEASAAASDLPETELKTASLSGRVVDEGGRPIADATVWLEIAEEAQTNDILKSWRVRTDQDGTYAIEGIDVFGPGEAFVGADGFVMQRNFRIDVKPGSDRKNLDFRLPAASHFVAGVVVDERGHPVPDATVSVPYFAYDEQGLTEVTAVSGVTTGNITNTKYVFGVSGDKGAFRVAIPSPGLCDCMVAKAGFAPAFYARIPTGTEDARFVLRSGGAIAGRVTTEDGKPAARVPVRVVGRVLPGNLPFSDVQIQSFAARTQTAVTNDEGQYRAEGLGEDFTYTVSVTAAEPPGGDPEAGPLADTLREIRESLGQARNVRAQKTGLRVRTGLTTTANLTLESQAGTAIYGRVTDRTTGKPVCPVAVWAAPPTPEGPPQGFPKNVCSTRVDGTYEIAITDIERPVRFGVGYHYMTEGGSAWRMTAPMTEIDLKPGERKECNFSIDAPFTAPLRFTYADGRPVQGVMPGIRTADRERGGCAAGETDAEGRAVKHGLPSGLELVAFALVMRGNRYVDLGASDPFVGNPGEEIDEVPVLCRGLGGIVTRLVDSQGKPLANVECGYVAVSEEGGTGIVEGVTDADGVLLVEDALFEGHYQRFGAGIQTEEGISAGVVDNVEIEAGRVTDLGTITVAPLTEEQAQALMSPN